MSILTDKLKNYNIILASGSPRRKEILTMLGIDFTVKTKPTQENYPENLKGGEIPQFLANLKASAFDEDLKNYYDDKTIIITADTIVYINNKVLGKPTDANNAVEMLKTLSGNMHEVFTGVCIKSKNKTASCFASTKVWFRNLSDEEINFYVNNYQPLDKAGAYAVQEWIGAAAISRIEGSFYNVMGLPSQLVFNELEKFINN